MKTNIKYGLNDYLRRTHKVFENAIELLFVRSSKPKLISVQIDDKVKERIIK